MFGVLPALQLLDGRNRFNEMQPDDDAGVDGAWISNTVFEPAWCGRRCHHMIADAVAEIFDTASDGHSSVSTPHIDKARAPDMRQPPELLAQVLQLQKQPRHRPASERSAVEPATALPDDRLAHIESMLRALADEQQRLRQHAAPPARDTSDSESSDSIAVEHQRLVQARRHRSAFLRRAVPRPDDAARSSRDGSAEPALRSPGPTPHASTPARPHSDEELRRPSASSVSTAPPSARDKARAPVPAKLPTGKNSGPSAAGKVGEKGVSFQLGRELSDERQRRLQAETSARTVAAWTCANRVTDFCSWCARSRRSRPRTRPAPPSTRPRCRRSSDCRRR